MRGIGSLYYLMYAIQHDLPEDLAPDLIQLTLIAVTLSILVHGTSVKPLTSRFGVTASVCLCNAYPMQRERCLFRSAPHRRAAARLLILFHRTPGIDRVTSCLIPLYFSLYKENPMKTLTSPRFCLGDLVTKQATNGDQHD